MVSTQNRFHKGHLLRNKSHFNELRKISIEEVTTPFQIDKYTACHTTPRESLKIQDSDL